MNKSQLQEILSHINIIGEGIIVAQMENGVKLDRIIAILEKRAKPAPTQASKPASKRKYNRKAKADG